MEYREALEYIESTPRMTREPGLSRMEELMQKLGDPQKGMKYIHVAGTNGKGSVSAMLASVMKAAGYKTGLFTSPHIMRFTERMKINNKEIEEDEFAQLMTQIKPIADAMESKPTEFELITAAALCWFAQEKCDIAVLEVGLGGRFDATNIISSPEAAVIMNIGLDHTGILGDTLEKIAYEKAGIIKLGCDVVLYQQSESVMNVVCEQCEKQGARLHTSDFAQISCEFDSLDGQVFSYKGEPIAIPLLGANQRSNAAVVAETIQVLREKGWELDPGDVEHGFYSVAWPARFEIVSDEPYFVVDGGHNPQCAETVAENIKSYFPDRKHVLLIGVMRDKDYAALSEILNAVADEYVCVTPYDGERALPADELGEALKRFGKPVTVCESIRDAVVTAADLAGDDGMVCATGSLYMAGEIRACFSLK